MLCAVMWLIHCRSPQSLFMRLALFRSVLGQRKEKVVSIKEEDSLRFQSFSYKIEAKQDGCKCLISLEPMEIFFFPFKILLLWGWEG